MCGTVFPGILTCSIYSWGSRSVYITLHRYTAHTNPSFTTQCCRCDPMCLNKWSSIWSHLKNHYQPWALHKALHPTLDTLQITAIYFEASTLFLVKQFGQVWQGTYSGSLHPSFRSPSFFLIFLSRSASASDASVHIQHGHNGSRNSTLSQLVLTKSRIKNAEVLKLN